MDQASSRPTVTLSRRELINGLAAGSVLAFTGAGVTGCTTNEALGRSQLLLVSDGQLAQLANQSWTHKRRTSQPSHGGRKSTGERIGRPSAGLLHDHSLPLSWAFKPSGN